VNIRKLLVTFFGAGLSPIAPGTAGSLAACLILLGLLQLQPSHWTWQAILLAGLILASMGTVAFGGWAIVHFKRPDPQPVVLDEVAGICLTALLQPTDHPVWMIVAVFLAFRLFDVIKPWPVRLLELLPGGWGILLDDLGAAVLANGLCQILLRVVLPRLGGSHL
jgi:phosphatidylglycerophosphatase A